MINEVDEMIEDELNRISIQIEDSARNPGVVQEAAATQEERKRPESHSSNASRLVEEEL